METKMLASLSRCLIIEVNKDELQVEWKYVRGSKNNVIGGKNFSFIFKLW